MSVYEHRVNTPLAEKLRPRELDEVVGQKHLTKKTGLIYKSLAKDLLPSMIFWGPPGSGKTTIARIIATKANAEFVELSAVNSGVKDIKRVIELAESRRRLGEKTILFIDEIHRFNKSQQDGLLPVVEDGTITLIGATTENPSFEVISPLLSRTTVLKFNQVPKSEIADLLRKAKDQIYKNKTIDDKAIDLIAEASLGDARSALTSLEIAASLANKITAKVASEALQSQAVSHDKGGESHYNLASALIKSMRGSASEPALYYLHRMLQAGDDPIFIARRMVIFASEDVGMASPHALTLAVSAFTATQQIGMPEANYILSQAVVAMCEAKKSRRTTDMMAEAMKLARQHPSAEIPLHLRNAPTTLMKDFGYGQGYKWEADHQPDKGFWPDSISAGEG